MPKLDLTRAARIKGAGGEIARLRGPGFVWARPVAADWAITPGDGGAVINASPTVIGTWDITATDGGAIINTSPGSAAMFLSGQTLDGSGAWSGEQMTINGQEIA